MKYVTTLLAAVAFGGAMACLPANAHHNGETGGIVREGGHYHAPPSHQKAKSKIVREGGHSHRPTAKAHHAAHWGKHHHNGVHLEGSH